MCIYIHIYIHIHICTHTYTHTHIYIYIYIFTYIYIYTQTCFLFFNKITFGIPGSPCSSRRTFFQKFNFSGLQAPQDRSGEHFFSEMQLFEKLFFRPVAPSGGIHFQKSHFWHGRRLGAKMMQNHNVFLSKVARPSISRRRNEGNPHDLRSLRTKVSG